MLYLLAVLLPPAVFFSINKPGEGILNAVLWISCCGTPLAVGWSAWTAYQHMEDQRTQRVTDAIRESQGGSRKRRDDDD